MKNRKLIALLLCFAMVLSMLAGCSAETAGTADQAQTEAAKAEDAKTETNAAEAGTSASACTPVGTLPIIPEGQECTLTIALRQSPLTENYDTNDFTLWLEEKTGINLEFTYLSADPTECNTQIALMLSSGEKLPDIFWDCSGLEITAANEYGEDGYFIDLNPYFEKYATYWHESYDQLSESDQKMIFSVGKDAKNGALYGFPRFEICPGLDNCVSSAVINTKWLEKLGLEKPETIDEFVDVLTKFVNEDPNGNGQKDEIGSVGWPREWRSNLLLYLLNAYVYTNDDYFFNATDGKLWVPYTTDEYRQGLIKLNEMYKNGLISPVTFSIADWSEITTMFTPSDGVSKLGFNAGYPLFCTEQDSEVIYEYEPLAPLKGATSLGGYGATMAPVLNYETFITCDCANPEAAFRLLDLMSSKEGFLWMRYGKYGRDWDWAKEGQTSSFGTTAVIDVLDSSIYSNQNNANWHCMSSTIAAYNLYPEAFEDDGSWQSNFDKLHNEISATYDAAPKPDEVVYYLTYNEAETEVVSEVATVLLQYIQEARALFVTGAMDPTNDADWQTYLDACEGQGLSRYLEAAQAAYSRANN